MPVPMGAPFPAGSWLPVAPCPLGGGGGGPWAMQHGHCENDQVYVPFHILNFFFVSDSEYFTAITAELPWLKAGTCPALTGKFTK
jgi:hypothetical protein